MKVVALEEHVATPYYASKQHLPRLPRSKKLGHEISDELLDIDVSRLKYMDEAGIDVQVLSLTTPGAQGFRARNARAIARDANDVIHEAVKRHPTRFQGFAALPTADPKAAALELERAVSELGFKGAMINGHCRGDFLDHKKFWPIFEAAQQLGVPIYLHPREVLPGMRAYFKGYDELSRAPWGFAMDTGAHFLRIMASGVFDAFPNLQFILGHLGEGLPFFLHRIHDHTYQGFALRGLERTARDYMTQNLSVTCSGNFSIPSLLCTIEVLGIDRVMFSVDWPYETNKVAMDFFAKVPLENEDKAKLGHANAERLLRL